MKLTERDKKILGFLFHHNRDSVADIAKKLNIPRQVVDYNIKRYISDGIIKKFFTVFNYEALGYNLQVMLFVKLKNLHEKQNFLNSMPKNILISKGEALTKYHLFFNLLFKDQFSLNEVLSKIISQEIVEDYLLVNPYSFELYPLKFLGENKSNIYDLKKENKIKPEISIDKTDIEILKALNDDGRVRVIDIANKLKANPETILYKLKRLQKEEIILGNRIQFNMSKFGFHYSLALVNIKNLNKEKEKKLVHFFRKHLFINSYGLFLNNPNCFFQIFHKTEEELRNTLFDFEKMMENNSYEINLIPLFEAESEEINTLPFY